MADVTRPHPVASQAGGRAEAGKGASEYLALVDWRRRVTRLYADWRASSADDPARATGALRAARDKLFRDHPQSPLADDDRAVFRGLDYWPYDPAYRMEVALETDPRVPPPEPGSDAEQAGDGEALPESHPTGSRFRRIGRVRLRGPLEGETLAVYWITAYGGGLFLPFRDATAGGETYGAGRYLLDTIKGADLGGDPERGTLLLDFNMAYPPSCAYDPRWACPLAPIDTFVTRPIPVGERLYVRGGSLPS